MGPSHLRGGGLRAQSLQLRGELAVRRRLLHARATPSHGRP